MTLPVVTFVEDEDSKLHYNFNHTGGINQTWRIKTPGGTATFTDYEVGVLGPAVGLNEQQAVINRICDNARSVAGYDGASGFWDWLRDVGLYDFNKDCFKPFVLRNMSYLRQEFKTYRRWLRQAERIHLFGYYMEAE